MHFTKDPVYPLQAGGSCPHGDSLRRGKSGDKLLAATARCYSIYRPNRAEIAEDSLVDAMDILGDLLGHKTRKSGRGTDVLKDIFGRGSRSSGKTSRPVPDDSIRQQSRELEELLNVAHERSTGHRPRSQGSESARREPAGTSRDRIPRDRAVETPQPQGNERAVLLIRAMVNAAKADGRLDRDEQQAIIDRMANPTRESIDFLRQEFARPLNVDEFAREVPIGMEQQVYTMSLIAIDLDTGSEATYLMDLAERLRIPVDIREKIHQQLNAPSIY
jgi:hypothetical protein